jgi:hypothetical protein
MMAAWGKEKVHVSAPMTARMLLVIVLGDEHKLHSVMKWAVGSNGALQIVCTCGGLGTTPYSPENLRALRNMRYAGDE